MFNKYKISRFHLKVKLSVQLSTVSCMFYSYFYGLDLKSILMCFFFSEENIVSPSCSETQVSCSPEIKLVLKGPSTPGVRRDSKTIFVLIS